MASTPTRTASSTSGHDTDTPESFPQKKRKHFHTTDEQRERLLEWLELPGNFDLLTKPKISDSPTTNFIGKKPKKSDGYRALAQYMNRVTLVEWSGQTARSRFESFMGVYRKAKRQNPLDLSPIFQRVDALFGTDGDQETKKMRSESLGQWSEVSRSAMILWSDEQEPSSSPLQRRSKVETMVEVDALTGDQALRVESQRLAVRQLELELKQNELRVRQDENRQKLRAEVLTKLVEAGKSPAEVREYLAIMSE